MSNSPATTAEQETAPASVVPTKTFADFGLDPLLSESLAEAGIINPFPIQEMTLPLALTGADIIGQARTGTGKTLAFGLPMLQRLDLDGGLQTLIIVPTRELCLQVAEDLAQAGRAKGVTVAAVYGGKAMQPQIDAIAGGAQVVAGTPGRLLDLSRRGFLNLSKCRGLVLDEADEMLDLGFLPDVEALIEQCADERQTLLFSATMPAAIVGLARRYMTKPTFMRADVEEINIAPATKQFFFSCHRMDKPAVLARILSTPNRGLCVVFCRTKRMADQLAEDLRERDIAAQAIHSDLRQEARERAMEKFRKGTTTVLCATEVAARGLDIDDVTHVVNYDCPDDEKMYLHRIGRTGRAGADGVAITFALWNEMERLEMIRRELDIDEEIHEVFSTSPELEEWFDLPAQEEKKKVPSPPKARTGKDSKSRRRAEKSSDTTSKGDGRSRRSSANSDDDRGSRRGRSESSEDTSRPTRAKASSRATANEAVTDDDGTVTRRRTRRRGGDVGTSGEDGANKATDTDTKAEDAPSGRGERSEAGSSRSRTRSRSAAGEESGSGKRSDRGTTDRDDAETGGSDREGQRRSGRGESAAERGGRRPRSRQAESGRDTKGADTKGADTKGADTKGADTKGSDTTRAGGGSAGKGSTSGSDRNRSKSGGRDGNRGSGSKSSGGRGRNGGSRNSGNRSDQNSGRGQVERSRSRDRDRTRERSRSAINADDARGEGAPRLNRKLEVTHLP